MFHSQDSFIPLWWCCLLNYLLLDFFKILNGLDPSCLFAPVKQFLSHCCYYSAVCWRALKLNTLVKFVLIKQNITQTERKSPLFDGYKQAGQHPIVIFWYSTYNSKLGHWGQLPRFKKQKQYRVSMLLSKLWFSRFFSRDFSDKTFLIRLFSILFIQTHTRPLRSYAHARTQTRTHLSYLNTQSTPKKHAALSQNCTGCLLMGHSKWDAHHSQTQHHTVTMHDADEIDDWGVMLHGRLAHVHTNSHSACWTLILNLFLSCCFFFFTLQLKTFTYTNSSVSNWRRQ